jgi:hypothetical protein
MKNLIFITIASVAFSQTPLTNEERLEVENASLKLQLLKIQESEIQKKLKDVLESACKKANVPVGECQLDMQNSRLVRVPKEEKDQK